MANVKSVAGDATLNHHVKLVGNAQDEYDKALRENFKIMANPNADAEAKAKAQSRVKMAEVVMDFATQQLGSFLRKLEKLIDELKLRG